MGCRPTISRSASRFPATGRSGSRWRIQYPRARAGRAPAKLPREPTASGTRSAIDAAGYAWYTEAQAADLARLDRRHHRVLRACDAGGSARPARRRANGDVWFAGQPRECDCAQEGRLTRHVLGSLTPTAPMDTQLRHRRVVGGPRVGHAQNASKLLRISASGEDGVRRRRAEAAGDVAVGIDGHRRFRRSPRTRSVALPRPF